MEGANKREVGNSAKLNKQGQGDDPNNTNSGRAPMYTVKNYIKSAFSY